MKNCIMCTEQNLGGNKSCLLDSSGLLLLHVSWYWCSRIQSTWHSIFVWLQHAYSMSDVQVSYNSEHQYGKDIIPNMTRDNNVKYMTFYEDGESIPGKRTAVWEIDKSAFLWCLFRLTMKDEVKMLERCDKWVLWCSWSQKYSEVSCSSSWAMVRDISWISSWSETGFRLQRLVTPEMLITGLV